MIPLSAHSLQFSLIGERMARAHVPLSLTQLTCDLKAGDDGAWAKFHRDFGPGIFRQLLAGAWGDHDLASEALQQTYLRVARHVRPCDSLPMFRGWLRTIAQSALNDGLRKRRSFNQLRQRQMVLLSESGHETDSEIRLHAALDATLAEITSADRELLAAKYFSGISVRVLAQQLQISEKAVESRLSRARADLRKRLLARISLNE